MTAQSQTLHWCSKCGFTKKKFFCRVCHNITSHLSDLYGMSQWYDKYGVLGLNPTAVHSAVQTAGAFAVKASELQQ